MPLPTNSDKQPLEEIAHKVKAIKNQNPSLAQIAQWIGDFLSESVQVTGKFHTPDLKLDQKQLPDSWFKGKALLDPIKLSLDWEQAGALYKRLLKLVEKSKEGRRQLPGLERAISKDQGNSHSLMKAFLASDFETIETAASAFDVDPSVLILLFRMSLRPALLKVALAVLDRFDLSSWLYGHCPVCGSAPKLASLSSENGKRQLHCSLCETGWFFPRLRCPFCEIDDPENLSYIKAETENEKGLRVDLCTNCGRYIKTIDLREVPGPVIVPVDDVATWHLDWIVLKVTNKNQAPTASLT
jgi:FdhE protein